MSNSSCKISIVIILTILTNQHIKLVIRFMERTLTRLVNPLKTNWTPGKTTKYREVADFSDSSPDKEVLVLNKLRPERSVPKLLQIKKEESIDKTVLLYKVQ